jgi:hypothetical protein
MKEELRSSETSVLTRATWRNIPEDAILQVLLPREVLLQLNLHYRHLLTCSAAEGRRCGLHATSASAKALPRLAALAASCHALPLLAALAASCRVLPRLPRLAVPCLSLPRPAPPCRSLPCPAAPCRALPRPAAPCPSLSLPFPFESGTVCI